MTETCTSTQLECVEEIFQRIASDLSMIADRELTLKTTGVEVCDARPAGEGKIHISFRLGFRVGEERHHGCLVVPLPDAISLACSLMMVPEDTLVTSRTLTNLDETTKDAMLEVGNFVTGATECALRALGIDAVKVSFEGCQGVRADVRPALTYRDGDPLVVGRAQINLADFPADEVLLMVPPELVPDHGE